MKKLFLMGALALFGAVNAQTFGIKAGVNFANVSNADTFTNAMSQLLGVQVTAKGRTGMHAGFFMNAPIAENLSIQPEFLYNSKGMKFTAMGQSITWSMDYLSVPVMFQYNATPKFYLEAGPELSLLLSSKMKAAGESQDAKDGMNSFDFGLGLGAGYYFTNNIGVSARYVAGMMDVAKDNTSDTKFKNNVFQLGLVYKFSK